MHHLPRTILLQHYDTSITPPRRTKQQTSIAKHEYPHFDTILAFRDHSTLILYLLYYNNFLYYNDFLIVLPL